MSFSFKEYQSAARRTQNPDLTPRERLEHATWLLAAEVGEVLGLHQKKHQGHILNYVELRKEIGDVLWGLAELCDVYKFDMGMIAEENIAKLKRRFPDGFDVEHSLHRQEGDV